MNVIFPQTTIYLFTQSFLLSEALWHHYDGDKLLSSLWRNFILLQQQEFRKSSHKKPIFWFLFEAFEDFSGEAALQPICNPPFEAIRWRSDRQQQRADAEMWRAPSSLKCHTQLSWFMENFTDQVWLCCVLIQSVSSGWLLFCEGWEQATELK